MAYDPEARETSNSALIIGIVALVLVVGGLLAYYATRSNEPATTIVSNPNPTVIREEVVVPGTPAPPVVVQAPAPAPRVIVVPGQNTTTRTNTTRTETRVVPAPNPAGGTSNRAPAGNVTINNNLPAPRTGNTATGGSGTAAGSTAATGDQEDAAANAVAPTPAY